MRFPSRYVICHAASIILLALFSACGTPNEKFKGVPFGKPVAPELYGPYPGVLSLDVSDDGKYLAAGLVSGVRVWDIAERKPVLYAKTPITQHVYDLEFISGTHNLLVATINKQLELWDVDTQKLLGRMQGEDFFYPLAVSPNGRYVANGSKDYLEVWDLKQLRRISRFKGPSEGVQDMQWLPDNKTLATSSNWDNQVVFWDALAGKKRIALKSETFGLAVSPDGRLLAHRREEKIGLWDIQAKKRFRELAQFEYGVGYYSFAFSPDGKLLAAAELGGDVGIWDVQTGKLLVEYDGPFGDGLCVEFSPDGKRVFSGGHYDRTVRQWDVPAPTPATQPAKP